MASAIKPLASCWDAAARSLLDQASAPLAGKWTKGWPTIQGFDLISEIGRGGMGVVYRACDCATGLEVAIKVIRPEGSSTLDPGTLGRFRREVRAAARLDDPHMVTVFDAGITDDAYFLVMELVKGVDLQQLVDGNGPILIDAACDYIRQTALGLQHAHEQGMVHRDIKPANLILVEDSDCPAAPHGRIKVLDLGLARMCHAADGCSSVLTHEGIIVGTPDYMAPEQVENSHDVDIRADLYSLGCTFYTLLTGQVPFPARTIMEKLDQHRWRKPRSVERIRRGIPPAVSAVVEKLLAKKPEDRFATPAEVVKAIEAVDFSRKIATSADARRRKAETDYDFAIDTITEHFGAKGAIGAELDRLQQALAERIESNDFAGALPLAEAMVRLKPDDSLAIAACAFAREQVNRTEKPGEIGRIDVAREAFHGVAVSPDGRRLAACGSNIYVWDADTLQSQHAFGNHAGGFCGVAFSPDSRCLVSAGGDACVRLWDVAALRSMATFRRHTAAVSSVAFAPSGRAFLSAGADASVYLSDIGTGHRLATMRGHTTAVRAVAGSADGRSAVSASWDHTIRVWEMETGAERGRLGSSLDYFTSVAMTSDGKRVLAGGGANNQVHLYDIETGQLLRQLEGHTNWIMSVAVSPDGRFAVSSGYDGTVRLWNLTTGLERHCFTGHTNWVMSVAFYPDGRRVASAGADGTVRVWRLGSLDADAGKASKPQS